MSRHHDDQTICIGLNLTISYRYNLKVYDRLQSLRHLVISRIKFVKSIYVQSLVCQEFKEFHTSRDQYVKVWHQFSPSDILFVCTMLWLFRVQCAGTSICQRLRLCMSSSLPYNRSEDMYVRNSVCEELSLSGREVCIW